MRQVMRGSISSELLMCGGSVHSILLLPLVARCIEEIDVYDACLLCSSVFYPWSVEVCYMFGLRDVMDVVFSVSIVRRGAVGVCIWGV